jgi:hypothetical protein
MLRGWLQCVFWVAMQLPSNPDPIPRRVRVSEMRPGDYFGALFLTVLFAVVIGVLAALWIAAWVVTNQFHTTTPAFPTLPP